MKESTDSGKNKTGMGMSPKLGGRMLEIESQTPKSKANGQDIAKIRSDFVHSSQPIGSTPPPTGAKGVAKAGAQMLKGKKASVLLNKLGERLAFERTGMRLYEALLAKFEDGETWVDGPSREELEHFRDEELEHFHMVHEAIESMGGDPTAVTPAADVSGVASEGIMKVITDPRMSLSESLDALLAAELVDNDGWEMLIELTQDLGQDNLTQRFQEALRAEQLHLSAVRQWLIADNKSKAELI